MRLIRCIHHNEFIDVRDGKWNHDRIRVYYGFNNYRDDPEHIEALVREILAEYPDMKKSDMHIHRVSTTESIRHAHFTTVQVVVDADRVRNNLMDDYDIL